MVSILRCTILAALVIYASAFLQPKSSQSYPTYTLRSSAQHPEINTTPNQSSRPPFRLQCIDHVVIRCKAFEPMFDFYHRILGCTIDEPANSHLNRFGGALTHLRAGSCYIDLLAYDPEHVSNDGLEAVRKMHSGGQGVSSLNDVQFSSGSSTLDHLCIRVEPFDEEEMMDYLVKQNVPIVVAGGNRLGADGVGVSIYVSDPEGNVVELKGPPKRSTMEPSDGVKNEDKSSAPTQTDIIDKSASIANARDDLDAPISTGSSQSSALPNEEDVSSTPCIRICRYNSSFHDGQVCIGCYREAFEISKWGSMSAIEKSMTLLDAIDRCDGGEGTFEGAISKDELIRQCKYWERMTKSTGNS